MSAIRGIVILLLSCASGACAIHPLPENVTGVKTAQIVHRNRCEAQEALRHIEGWLVEKHNVVAAEMLTKIGVVLSYSLDMSETNGLTANTTFAQILANSTTTFTPTSTDMLMRENTRAFTVADNFKTLMSMKQCSTEPAGPSFQYPIVGTIGIGETIRSFLTMALHEDLNNSSENPQEPPTSQSMAGAPTMVDTLIFTTTVSAGVNPMIMLTPIGTALQLTNASLNFTLQRQDTHQVTIGLGLPIIAPPVDDIHHFVPYSIASLGRANSARNRTPLLIDASVPVGSGPASGVSIAMEATNNEIIRRELLRGSLVTLH
jgi:hypothetical protein